MRLFWAGAWRDRLRLWSGLTLFVFALTHFLNHALGLWSLDAMTRAQAWRVAVTRSPPVTALLVVALLVHASLALMKLARARTFRMGRAEIAAGLSGFTIPLFLMPHLFAAGVGPREAGVFADYPNVLRLIWPAAMAWQSLLLIVVWAHGCIGLHYWLRAEGWYRRASHLGAALAALVPAAALAGVMSAGREAARLDASHVAQPLSQATRSVLAAQSWQTTSLTYALVAIVALIPLSRLWRAHRPRGFAIQYAEGPLVLTPPGPTLLEISRANGVPHLSTCGGKARCSTCRVRVDIGSQWLGPPGEAEQMLLKRIGAPADVRLACQIRPMGPLTVTRLLKPENNSRAPAPAAEGVDREAAILFVDIRGFTRLSQAKLAYDIVHILNSFFAGAGQAIEGAGGRVDKYIGDGLMAVFEHGQGGRGAARAAVEAAKVIDRELETINQRLAGEITEPLRLAMGLHVGRLVMGRIGWGAAAAPTVIGPAVNVASRLESLAKSRDVELALSRECAVAAGVLIGELTIEDVDIRGLDAAFPVALVSRVRDLELAGEGAM